MILALYDRTLNELRRRLVDNFPPGLNLDYEVAAAAYYVCSAVINKGMDWESKIEEYTLFVLETSEREHEAEQIELLLLHNSLRHASAPLLDVGAGWGRLGKSYAEQQLHPFFIEPSILGCQLMRRNGLRRVTRASGQRICFPSTTFHTVLITWVLHHDSPDVPALEVIQEIARVITPGGNLISIEPLSEDFTQEKWLTLIEENGFKIQRLEIYYEIPDDNSRQYAFLEAKRVEQVIER